MNNYISRAIIYFKKLQSLANNHSDGVKNGCYEFAILFNLGVYPSPIIITIVSIVGHFTWSNGDSLTVF